MAKAVQRAMRKIFEPRVNGTAAFGLLLVRAVFGVAMMLHGLPKIQNPLHWMGPDSPIHPGLQALAAFSEFFGGLAWVVGLLTPLAALGVACVMLKAMDVLGARTGIQFVANPPQPSFELPALFFAVALMLIFTGAGSMSLDAALFRGKSKRPIKG
jgi:putative oxidoreductase